MQREIVLTVQSLGTDREGHVRFHFSDFRKRHAMAQRYFSAKVTKYITKTVFFAKLDTDTCSSTMQYQDINYAYFSHIFRILISANRDVGE